MKNNGNHRSKKQITIARHLEDEAEQLRNCGFVPRMYADYITGMTYGQLAERYGIIEMFHLDEKCKKPDEVARAIVGETLRRYAPDHNERREVSVSRSLDNLTLGQNGTHFKSLDPNEIRAVSLSGVVAQGKLPLTDAEKKQIEQLTKDPTYQTSHGINRKKIAEELNRTPSSIGSYLSKQRKKQDG